MVAAWKVCAALFLAVSSYLSLSILYRRQSSPRKSKRIATASQAAAVLKGLAVRRFAEVCSEHVR
jgi:hypothetical protein